MKSRCPWVNKNSLKERNRNRNYGGKIGKSHWGIIWISSVPSRNSQVQAGTVKVIEYDVNLITHHFFLKAFIAD